VERAREKQDAVTDRDVLNVMHLSQDASGRSMRYPIGRHVGTSLGAFLVGAAFTAVGWWLITNEGHTLFGSVFGGIGALVGVVALYMMINSLEVSRDGNDIRSVRRILGIPVQRRSMSRDAFVKFTKESSFQSQGGGKHVMYYSIYATDFEGQKLRVGEGFKGESEARAAIRLIARELGLENTDAPVDRRTSGKAWDPAGLLRASNEPGI
jgi:hypothetical protein